MSSAFESTSESTSETAPDPAPASASESGIDAPSSDAVASGGAGPDEVRAPLVARWLLWIAGLTLAFSVGIAASNLYRMPYYRISPGPSERTEPMVKVEGAPSYKHPHQLFLTTVSVAGLTPLQWVLAKLDGKDEITPKAKVDGDRSAADVDRLNAELMSQSKLTATKVALEKLGYPVTFASDGTIVASVQKDTPAAKLLRPGQVVRSVDGGKVNTSVEVVKAIAGKKPGDTVVLEVETTNDNAGKSASTSKASTKPDGAPPAAVTTTSTVTVPMVAAPAGSSNPAMIGITLKPYKLRIVSPVTVTITSDGIGGPSAGLAYTLQIIQTMTSDDILKAGRVAATGEIETDGSVGPIGGIAQKVRSVEKAGAKVFLVPKENYDEAAKAATRVKVVAVTTLDEALASARTIA